MFRLAAEIVESGGRVLTTTTTRIFAAQTRLAPVHVQSLADLPEALKTSAHVLLTGEVDADSGKAFGVSPDLICSLRALVSNILIEADGSRMRPFKAPADHEPVIPDCVTIVVPVVGIDAIGRPLDDRYVHRPELIVRLLDPAGLGGKVGHSDPKGLMITPEMVATVLGHPLGGRKNVPKNARVVPLINKVETEEQLLVARQLAERIKAQPGIDAAVIGAVARPDPIWM